MKFFDLFGTSTSAFHWSKESRLLTNVMYPLDGTLVSQHIYVLKHQRYYIVHVIESLLGKVDGNVEKGATPPSGCMLAGHQRIAPACLLQG